MLEEEPDITLAAISERFLIERGVKVTTGMLSYFYIGEEISFKKSILPSEQDRPDVAHRRKNWKKYQDRIDPRRLVFIDETWIKTNMTRTHGRCRKGKRLRAKVPHGRWTTLTFLAGLRHDRIDAPCVIDGPINGERFLAYVEQFLVPTLKPGDIVIMESEACHLGIISAPTREKLSGLPSDPPVPNCSSCPNTRPISTRSNRSFPKSRP